ncbi:FAD-dependent oxidoreductase [Histidinibacterium aquaticum]|uniref:FAD-binding protein n=1 Tax=Histidinibacterium aquaticum TaxID=2613962 RepID=A0A5J5GRF1_9RHOB|nr:FAD-binding protein [Histidinibacterium aquaticum]KAA9009942.1 FAD-binding protein [Histidinibacterium aquaticum]
MTRKRNNPKNKRDDHKTDESGLSRREFFAAGAAAGAGAAALGGPTAVQAAAHEEGEMQWDYEADVVVLGAGCTGLPAAIRARDLGASVIVIDQNFDAGGRMLHSGAWVSLGGGDPIQQRDAAGELDEEGFIQVDPLVPQEALDDDVELLFRDVTDWSVLDEQGYAYYRYNNPDQHRGWAENCPPTRQFLMDNYCRFARIDGTHFGGGVSRARASSVFLTLGDTTDIEAGTITQEDAGVADPERSSPMCPRQLSISADRVGLNAVHGGGAMSRCLEYSARQKGVEFMFNRHMDELIQDSSGRVIGVRATYTPRQDPETGEQLQSFWSNGNIEETAETVTIKANRAVIVGTGGHAGNPNFRSQFYPRMNEPYYPTSGWALLGGEGRAADASGILAGMKAGASLDGLHQNFGRRTYHIQTRLGVRDAYTDMYPGHPTFPFRGSAGFNVGQAGFEHLIAVNQVGRRFFNEMALPDEPIEPRYPGGIEHAVPNTWDEHTPYDWRNCRIDWVREMYHFTHGVDAALQINEGSEAPEYYSGPIWAIFDSAAVERGDFPIREPFISTENGQFFQADTLEELAEQIQSGNEFQRVPLEHLVETVEQWNSYVDEGSDPDFERGQDDAPMHRIDQPPYYAASIMVVWHDSYGGLRLNRNCQVLDNEMQPIPGLFAGGEASGGGQMHGLGRATVHGYIAGTEAMSDETNPMPATDASTEGSADMEDADVPTEDVD